MLKVILIIAVISSVLGLLMFFMNKTSFKVLQNCPCKKIIQSGFTAKFFAYFGSFCFMYSVTFMGYDIINIRLILLFICSIILLWLSFILKA